MRSCPAGFSIVSRVVFAGVPLIVAALAIAPAIPTPSAIWTTASACIALPIRLRLSALQRCRRPEHLRYPTRTLPAQPFTLCVVRQLRTPPRPNRFQSHTLSNKHGSYPSSVTTPSTWFVANFYCLLSALAAGGHHPAHAYSMRAISLNRTCINSALHSAFVDTNSSKVVAFARDMIVDRIRT